MLLNRFNITKSEFKKQVKKILFFSQPDFLDLT